MAQSQFTPTPNVSTHADAETVINDNATDAESRLTSLEATPPTHTQTASTITDFDTEVGNNAAVALNTAKATNVSTDLSYTASPTDGTVVSSDGTDATLPLVDVTNAGLIAPAANAKLGNISVTQAVDLDTLETDSHTHANKATLDATTASFTGDAAELTSGTLPAARLDAGTVSSLASADSAVQPADDAATLGSGAAADNLILTADGAGGAAWEAATGGSGDVSTDTIFDAKGDIVAGDGADSSQRVAIGTDGQILTADAASPAGVKWETVSGTGDMTAAVYDPTAVAGDAFAMDSMVEGATTKILTDTERSAISANTAKTSFTGDASDLTTGTLPIARIGAGTVTETELNASTNASLDLADSATQPLDDAATLGSGAAADSYVLTADGIGGAAWEASAGGSPTVATTAETSLWLDAGGFLTGTTLTAEASTVTGTNGSVDEWLMATGERVFAKTAMPPQWDGGAIDIEIFWTVTGGVATQNVKWEVAAQAGGNADSWDVPYPTPTATADDPIIGDDDIHVIEASTITVGGPPIDGDTLFIELTRATAGATIHSGEVRFLGVRVKYQNSLLQNWYVTKMGDETSDATAGEKTNFIAPAAGKIFAVHSGATTVPTGATLTADVKIDAVSILSTKGIIDAGEKTTTTGTLHALTTNPTTFAAGAVISFHVDTFGGTAAAGLHTDLLISWD